MKMPALSLSLVLFSFCLPAPLPAQEKPASGAATAGKGAAPLSIPQGATARVAPTTRAVVIGISDYREPLIPDLRFADRDAGAFADWLRAPDGAALPDSNIIFLANEKATTAKMIVALDWLIEASQPGDRAFIYFSGHGDVERVTKFGLGYLLSHDSPPAVYGAGAFPLHYLQAILTTLSENDVQVFIITDACRAGKLAGSDAKGAQATAAQLAQQFANEIKLLSCQPDEFSLEGAQWGGGRGLFSYHLEDALYGFADANADESVDMYELRRYLEEKVRAEADPESQVPMVLGPPRTAIATPGRAAVAARRAEKSDRPAPFQAIENRGLEALLLADADSNLRRLYDRFLAAVDSGRLLSPPDDCADGYFRQLENHPDMAALRGSMKRRLAAALIEDGQVVVNKVLQTDPQVLDNIWAKRVNYDHLPAYFERATEILGETHYAWRDLKAKEFYFRAMTIRRENYPDSSADWRTNEKRRHLNAALSIDSTIAIAYQALGYTYETTQERRVFYMKKAVEMAPNWALGYNQLGASFSIEAPLRISYYKKAIELDSNFLSSYNWISWRYDDLGKPDSAVFWRRLYIAKFNQKFQQDSSAITAYEWKDLGNAYWGLREFEKAKSLLLLSEKISGGKMVSVYFNLTVVYTDLMEFEIAVEVLNKAIANSNFNQRQTWGGNPANIYFNFLFDNKKAVEAYSKSKDKVNITDVQLWYLMDVPTAFNLASTRLVDTESKGLEVFAFYAGEAALKLGLADTAAFYFTQVVEMAEIEFNPNDYEMPEYLFAALAYDRLGRTEDARQLIEKAKSELEDDPWLHFNLARYYANTGRPEAAIESLYKAFKLGWQPNPLLWLEGTLCDHLLNPIRETEAYKQLVLKHFPKYYDIATRVPGKR